MGPDVSHAQCENVEPQTSEGTVPSVFNSENDEAITDSGIPGFKTPYRLFWSKEEDRKLFRCVYAFFLAVVEFCPIIDNKQGSCMMNTGYVESNMIHVPPE